MRLRPWIPALLLATLAAPPALALEDEQAACLDLLQEVSFEGFVPDGELDGYVGCLVVVEAGLAETDDPPNPEGPNVCLDGLWSLVGQDPAPDLEPGCVATLEEALAQDPVRDHGLPTVCFDMLWSLVGQELGAPEPEVGACVTQIEEAIAQKPDPAPDPPDLDACIDSLWELVSQMPDPAPDPPDLEICLADLEGWLADAPIPDPDSGR